MITNKCPQCDKIYENSLPAFCSNCGTALHKIEEDINNCTNPACPNHSKNLNPEDNFCTLCGAHTKFGIEVYKAIGKL